MRFKFWQYWKVVWRVITFGGSQSCLREKNAAQVIHEVLGNSRRHFQVPCPTYYPTTTSTCIVFSWLPIDVCTSRWTCQKGVTAKGGWLIVVDWSKVHSMWMCNLIAFRIAWIVLIAKQHTHQTPHVTSQHAVLLLFFLTTWTEPSIWSSHFYSGSCTITCHSTYLFV